MGLVDLGVPWVRLFRINTFKGYSAELFIFVFVFVFVLSAIEVLSGFARVCCTCAGRGRELVSSMGRAGALGAGDWGRPPPPPPPPRLGAHKSPEQTNKKQQKK